MDVKALLKSFFHLLMNQYMLNAHNYFMLLVFFLKFLLQILFLIITIIIIIRIKINITISTIS